jgi:hypothetical protein
MAISQSGANYKNQSELQRRDRLLGDALDDLASQNEAIRKQGNFGQQGAPDPPHPLTNILVKAANGFATVTLTHNNAPAGSNYVVQFSTTKNFQNPITVDNGISLTLQQYLKGQTLFFRAAPKFPTSTLAPWIYFGGQATPTAVSF